MENTVSSPMFTVRFNGGSLRIPLSLIPEDSAMMHLMDSKSEQDVEFTASHVLTTEHTVRLISQLLAGQPTGTITEDQWLNIAKIADFVDIGRLNKLVVNHYVQWLYANAYWIAKKYVDAPSFVDRVDLNMARRFLDPLIENSDDVLKMAPFGRGDWISKPIAGHTSAVNCMCLLSDGRLASGSDDGTVKIWDLVTRSCTGTLVCNAYGVTSTLALSGNRLAVGDYDGNITVWDTDSCAKVATLKGHGCQVHCLALLHDGRIASGSGDNLIKLWDVENAKCTATLVGHEDTVRCIVVLHDGRLASGSYDTSIILWDIATNVMTAKLVGHTRQITHLAVLLDGRLASVCHLGTTIMIWNTDSRQCVSQIRSKSAIRNMVALSDGTLATFSSSEGITVWNPATSTKLFSALYFHCHLSEVRSVLSLPDGRLVFSLDDPKRGWIMMYDLKTQTECYAIFCRASAVNTIEVMGDGRVVAGFEGGEISIFDMDTGAKKVIAYNNGSVVAMTMMQDGRLAFGSANGDVKIVDLSNGSMTYVGFHLSTVTGLCVLPNGNLASCSTDGSVCVWEPRSRFRVLHTPILDMVCVQDGHIVLLMSDGVLNIVDSTDMTSCETINDHQVDVCTDVPLCLSLTKPHKHDTVQSVVRRTFEQLKTTSKHCADLPDGRTASVAHDSDLQISGEFVNTFRKIDKLVATDDQRLVVAGYGVEVLHETPSVASVFLALTAAGVPSTYIMQVLECASK